MYKYEESIMNKEMSNKKSLKEMTAGLKTEHTVISFLNSEINIALLEKKFSIKKYLKISSILIELVKKKDFLWKCKIYILKHY